MRRADILVQKRCGIGKGAARTIRRAGRIPAIVYGGNEGPLPISVSKKEIEKTFHQAEGGENILLNLKLEDDQSEILTLIRESQHHPLKGDLEHLDFLRISLDRAIRTAVPIHAVGSAKGVREGGVFELLLREVEIECLPLDIPAHVEIDIQNMVIGDTLHVSDIPENPKYKILTVQDRAIALVAAPAKEVTPAVAAAEAAAAEAAAAEGEAKAASEEKAG